MLISRVLKYTYISSHWTFHNQIRISKLRPRQFGKVLNLQFDLIREYNIIGYESIVNTHIIENITYLLLANILAESIWRMTPISGAAIELRRGCTSSRRSSYGAQSLTPSWWPFLRQSLYSGHDHRISLGFETFSILNIRIYTLYTMYAIHIISNKWENRWIIVSYKWDV